MGHTNGIKRTPDFHLMGIGSLLQEKPSSPSSDSGHSLTPYPHEKTRLRKNWAEKREQVFVAAPMAVYDILKRPIQNDFKKKLS